MGDAAFEPGLGSEHLVAMDGVVVTGQASEHHHIGFGDGLGVRRAHANAQIFQVVTVDAIVIAFVSGVHSLNLRLRWLPGISRRQKGA